MQADVVQHAGELGGFQPLADLLILDLYTYSLLHCLSRSSFDGAGRAVVDDLLKRA